MTNLERLSLKILTERYGELSTEEALDLAINAEQIKLECGPTDPAFLHFAEEAQTLEIYALLREKEQS